VIDRGLPDMAGGTPDILARARRRVEELLSEYQRLPPPADHEQELITFALREAKESGLEGLPGVLLPVFAHEPGLI
jgi:hypothetical protein